MGEPAINPPELRVEAWLACRARVEPERSKVHPGKESAFGSCSFANRHGSQDPASSSSSPTLTKPFSNAFSTMVRLLQSLCGTTSTTVLAFASIASTMVDAHGYMTTPLAEFNPGVMKTSFSAKMDPVFPGKFNDNPQANAKTFTEAFNSPSNDKYKTLQDLLNGQGPECGYTNPNVSPKPIPADGVVVWQNPDSGEGFVPSHTGPCELWLDDKRVFNDDNCAGHYTGGSKAEIKIDFSSCKENCMLRFYWLSLQEPAWQIYRLQRQQRQLTVRRPIAIAICTKLRVANSDTIVICRKRGGTNSDFYSIANYVLRVTIANSSYVLRVTFASYVLRVTIANFVLRVANANADAPKLQQNSPIPKACDRQERALRLANWWYAW